MKAKHILELAGQDAAIAQILLDLILIDTSSLSIILNPVGKNFHGPIVCLYIGITLKLCLQTNF